MVGRKMFALVMISFVSFTHASSPVPETELSNGVLRLRIYLPDSKQGFYRGTRFDWAGVIADLRYKNHSYYGPWFTKTDAKVRDFIYDGPDIIAGPCSAITGPAEEFAPALGFDEAKPGGTFVKIGVGVLRKPDNEKYGAFRQYDLVDGGSRSLKQGKNFIEFRQEVRDAASGYGYIYTKTLRLIEGRPEMVIEHTLRNTGTRPIQGNTYNHNFLVLDKAPIGPALSIGLPFKASIDDVKNGEFVGVQPDNRIVFRKALAGKDRVFTAIDGFGSGPGDLKIRLENKSLGAGMVITGDRPIAKMALWSIRSVIAIEPFVDLSVSPGAESSWTFHYYYDTF